jgi:nucleoid-associated protein YgaU
MSLLEFIKDAGEKLFHTDPHKAVDTPSASTGTTTPTTSSNGSEVAALNQTASEAIVKYIASQNLPTDGLNVQYDGSSATVTVSGDVKDQDTREKIVLCCGNVHSVEHVDDKMTVDAPAGQAHYYTVKAGDNLSKISKEVYGDANRYNAIFEANRPMLSNPDKIYPGQTLRVPA